MNILFLSANPKNSDRLQLATEAREIQESLKRAKNTNQHTLTTQPATQLDDLRRALLDTPADIVHLSAHGEGEKGLLLENNQGKADYINNQALADLFKLYASTLQCVILNACHSDVQAKLISQHIPYVISMKHAIKDQAAITYSRAFYDAIAADKSIPFAHDVACNAMQFNHDEQHLIPTLTQSEQAVMPTAPQTTAQTRQQTPAQKLRQESLVKRQTLLLDKLSRLEEAYALKDESDITGQMRLEKTIADTQATLNEIEQALSTFH